MREERERKGRESKKGTTGTSLGNELTKTYMRGREKGGKRREEGGNCAHSSESKKSR